MTGEITLTGQVLPIGGLKEKSLAAQRAGIKKVIVPDRNQGDVEEISEHERAGLEFVYVDEIGGVLAAALEGGDSKPSGNSKPRASREKRRERAAARSKR
jgi:ATP-dependent Lon protease